jgi:hypothetical protein
MLTCIHKFKISLSEEENMVQKWMKSIDDRVTQAKAANEEFGACMLPSPTGGPAICEQLDLATCQNLGGTFLGGACGGTLAKWGGAIQARAAEAKTDGEEFGACMLPSPTGGPAICEQLDQSTCQNLGGTFLGGACGGAQVADFLAKQKKK